MYTSIYDHTKIKHLRRFNTIARCAELADVNYQQWQKWENGKTIPSAVNLALICTILNCNVEALFKHYESDDYNPVTVDQCEQLEIK